jgi:hypothetical protein
MGHRSPTGGKEETVSLMVVRGVALTETLGCSLDPLVHHSRHFGCTLHAMMNVQALLTNGLLQMVELTDRPEETFTAE